MPRLRPRTRPGSTSASRWCPAHPSTAAAHDRPRPSRPGSGPHASPGSSGRRTGGLRSVAARSWTQNAIGDRRMSIAKLMGAVVALALLLAAPAHADDLLGLPCSDQPDGTRVCAGDATHRIPSFDGVPLDANIV